MTLNRGCFPILTVVAVAMLTTQIQAGCNGVKCAANCQGDYCAANCTGTDCSAGCSGSNCDYTPPTITSTTITSTTTTATTITSTTTTATTTTEGPCDSLDLPSNIAAFYTDGNNPGSVAKFYCENPGESTDDDDRTVTCTGGTWAGDLSDLACTPCTGTNPKTGEVFTGDALSGPWHLYKKEYRGSASVALNDAKVWEASFSCGGSNFRFFEDGDYTSSYEGKVLTCRNGVWSDESRGSSYDGQLPFCCRNKGYTSTEFKRCCTRSDGTYNVVSGAAGNGYCSESFALTAGAEGSGVIIAAVDRDDDDDDDEWRPFEVYLAVLLSILVVLIAIGLLIISRRPTGVSSAAVLSGPGRQDRKGSEFFGRLPTDSPNGQMFNLLDQEGPAKSSTISEL